MEIIRLTKNEKEVLRLIHDNAGRPCTYPEHIYNQAVRTLDKKGLVQGAFVDGGMVIDARLTGIGRTYIAENPTLQNPIDLPTISVILSAIATATAIISLFVACSLIK